MLHGPPCPPAPGSLGACKAQLAPSARSTRAPGALALRKRLVLEEAVGSSPLDVVPVVL